MSADQSGAPAPKASADGARAGAGPKRPPRPPKAPDIAAPPGFGRMVSVAAPVATEADRWVDPTTETPRPAGATRSVDPPRASDPLGATAPRAPRSSTRPRSTDPRVRRGRRVKRVVRRIDLWSVLKLSIVVYTCLYIATLATLAALWGLLYSSGSIERLQSFLEDVGLDNFTFYGNQMFQACAAIGAVGVLAGTVVTVLATALVNVISEMTGGIRLVVIEEEPTA